MAIACYELGERESRRTADLGCIKLREMRHRVRARSCSSNRAPTAGVLRQASKRMEWLALAKNGFGTRQ